MKRFRFLLTLGLLTTLVAGCGARRQAAGTTSGRTVNAALVAKSRSYTDDKSRLAAMKSLERFEIRGTDYQVGPEDLLEISIFEWELREETKTATFRISETGFISLPVVGKLSVGGQTVSDIKHRIENRLTEGGFIQQPRVSVDIREYRSKKVAVIGAVRDPGVYTLRQNVTTLLDVLSLAGGLSDQAGYLAYVIQPGVTVAGSISGKHVIPIDLYELLQEGDLSLNMVLLGRGDVVNIPEAQTYSVMGHVRRPGNYPLKKPTTLLEGIAAGGGISEQTGALDGISFKRALPTGGSVVIPVNLIDIVEGRKANWYLRAGDVIEVPEDTGRRFTTELVRFVGNVIGVTYFINSSK